MGALELVYAYGQNVIEVAHSCCGGPEGLLRSAAGAIRSQRQGEDSNSGAGENTTVEHEALALITFADLHRLWLDRDVVQRQMQIYALRGGSEHKVALWESRGRVVKDLYIRSVATESVFDYLTDLMLSNYCFGDALTLEGFYMDGERLHIVTSQPYIPGRHPDFQALVDGLERRGLQHESPTSRIPSFLVDGGAAGTIVIQGLHENNVIEDEAGKMHPIDGHFFFADQPDRVRALEVMGLWQ